MIKYKFLHICRSKEDNEVMMTYDQCSHCSETELEHADGYGDRNLISTDEVKFHFTSF